MTFVCICYSKTKPKLPQHKVIYVITKHCLFIFWGVHFSKDHFTQITEINIFSLPPVVSLHAGIVINCPGLMTFFSVCLCDCGKSRCLCRCAHDMCLLNTKVCYSEHSQQQQLTCYFLAKVSLIFMRYGGIIALITY